MASIVCPCGGWYPRPTSTHDRGDTSRDTTSFIERTPCFFSGKNLHIAGLENLFRLACNQEGKLGRKKGQGGEGEGGGKRYVCGVCAIRQGRSNVASSARIRGDWIDLHKWSRCRRYSSLRPLVIFYTYFRPFQCCMLLYSDKKRGGDGPVSFIFKPDCVGDSGTTVFALLWGIGII